MADAREWRAGERGPRQQGSGPPPHPGDLGRRVLHRRLELGLSREQVAERAAIAPDYVRYVEEAPAQVNVETLVWLADALDTSPARLLGAAAGAPSGGSAGEGGQLKTLSGEECWELLTGQEVGHLAMTTVDGPAVFPVNFAVQRDRGIVFRTRQGSVLSAAAGQRVAFEVDRVEDDRRAGWSVLVVGDAEAVEASRTTAGRSTAERSAEASPWPEGHGKQRMRIVPSRITGRVIEPRPED